jgi:hypothetical protein
VLLGGPILSLHHALIVVGLPNAIRFPWLSVPMPVKVLHRVTRPLTR